MKKLLILLILPFLSLRADDFGGGFAAGAFTGLATGAIVGAASAPSGPSPRYGTEKRLQSKIRNKKDDIRKVQRDIDKYNRQISRLTQDIDSLRMQLAEIRGQ